MKPVAYINNFGGTPSYTLYDESFREPVLISHVECATTQQVFDRLPEGVEASVYICSKTVKEEGR